MFYIRMNITSRRCKKPYLMRMRHKKEDLKISFKVTEFPLEQQKLSPHEGFLTSVRRSSYDILSPHLKHEMLTLGETCSSFSC